MALTLHYNFQDNPGFDAVANPEGGTLGPTLVSASATDATVRDLDNVLRTVPASSGEGRFTGQRYVRNLCLNSQDFTAANWTAASLEVPVGSSGTAPDGTNTATLLECTAGNFDHRVYTAAFDTSTSRDYTLSVYAKAGTHSLVQLHDIVDGTRYVNFDLDNGTVTQESTAGIGRIEDAGDGWYRISISYSPISAAMGTAVHFIGAGTDARKPAFNAAGTETLYVWGSQAEDVTGQLDPAPSEYQATTTASAGKWYNTRRRTNLLDHSTELDTAPWTGNIVTLVGGQDDPTGASEAWLMYPTTSGTTRGIYHALSGLPKGVYTQSVYAKASGLDWIYFYNINNSDRAAWFNVSTGAVGQVNAGHTASITDVGNGWYRCEVTDLETPAYMQIFVADGDGVATSTTSGTDGALLYHAQFEKGSTATDKIRADGQVTSSIFHSTAGLYTESTNLCLQSEDLSTTWGNIRSIDEQAQGTAPDGTNTANKITDDSSTGENTAFSYQNITFVANTQYAFSAFLKADQLDWARLRVDGLTGLSISAFFDLTNGVVGATTGAQNDFESIESVGNGWYRCSITFTTTTDTSGSCNIYPADGNNDSGVDLDGTSSILMWGAQLESVEAALSKGPSTYIPTTTAAVTAGRYEPAPGLLVEVTSTNILKNSEDLSTTWTNWQSVDTQNEGTAPDGTNTANKITDDNGGGTGGCLVQQTSTTFALSSDYTMSAYLKADQLDWGELRVNSLGALLIYGYFDLANGVVGTLSADVDAAGIQDVGGGWYRCWITFGSDAADTSGDPAIYIAEADDDAVVDRDGTSSILVWGAQLELGDFLTSYIPTAAASVTRASSDVRATGAEAYLNDAAGTLYAEANPYDPLNSDFWGISKDAGLNPVFTLMCLTSDFRYVAYNGGYLADIRTTGGQLQANVFSKLVGTYAEDDFASSINGQTALTDTAGALGTGLNTIEVAITLASGGFSGHMKEMRYYDERLDNDVLQALTKGTDPDVSYTYAGDLDIGDSDWWRRRRILRRQRMLQFRRR